MRQTTIKEFDCVEMKRLAGQRIHQDLKDKTREEQLAYWRAKSLEGRAKFPAMRPLASSERHLSRREPPQ